MRLYLVRHGQTEWNATRRAQGHMDIPLDQVGRDQAARLASAFQDTKVDTVLTSDLQRSQTTAEAIADATGAALDVRKELRERSFGEWEGDDFESVNERLDALAETGGITRHDVRPPGGESYADVWARIDGVCRFLEVQPGAMVLVGHGGTCSLLLARLIHGSLDTSRAFRFRNTSITELERRPEGTFLMVRYNDTAHLAGASSPALSGSLDGVTR